MKKMKLLSVVLAITLLCGLCSGCSKKTASTDGVIEIKVPSALVGTDASAKYFAEDIAAFNKAYEGKYRAVVEEIPGGSNLAEKLNIMLMAGDVPDFVLGVSQDYANKAVKADLLLPLDEYLDADPEWKASISEEGLKKNTYNGKVYAIPRDKGLLGYYYNKEMYDKVGIKVAETWDEFWSNCDKLKAAGITPLALEPTWVSRLFFSAILATSGNEGYAVTNGDKVPTDFSSDEFIESLNTLRDAYVKYSSEEAITSKYDNAAIKFMNGQTAMIANGIWMTNDFADPNKAPEGFLDKVDIATFPGVVLSYPNIGLGIGRSTPEKEEAALALLKMFTAPELQARYMGTVGEFPDSPTVEISDELMKAKPLMAKLWDINNETELKSNHIGNVWDAGLLEVFDRNMPKFLTGDLDAKGMAKLLESEMANREN